MGRLSGKTALVTGASRGIGRAIACRLAREGALTIIHYGSGVAGAHETLAMIESAGGRGFIVQADLAKPAGTVRPMFDAIDEELALRTGTTRIDILVNNAGHLVHGTIDDLTSDQFDETFTIAVKAPFFIVQAALPRMSSGARIVNISSGTARIATPGVIAYSMAKGALNVFSRTLAQQLGTKQITVNAVAPGLTATDDVVKLAETAPDFIEHGMAQSALGRLGTVEEIASVVAFVASDEASWITGQVIDATGGAVIA